MLSGALTRNLERTLLGASGDLLDEVISTPIGVINIVTLFITPVTKSHDPPSTGSWGLQPNSRVCASLCWTLCWRLCLQRAGDERGFGFAR